VRLSRSLAAQWGIGECLLQLSLNCPSLAAVKRPPTPEVQVLEGACAGAEVCPLSHVQAGVVVCIKRLAASPEVTDRLRELGLCEEQRIKLLTRQSSYICQVCNARLAISDRLADSIMVQAVQGPLQEA
jgi:Fe2+ transport system protein FeoA